MSILWESLLLSFLYFFNNATLMMMMIILYFTVFALWSILRKSENVTYRLNAMGAKVKAEFFGATFRPVAE